MPNQACGFHRADVRERQIVVRAARPKSTGQSPGVGATQCMMDLPGATHHPSGRAGTPSSTRRSASASTGFTR